MNRYPTNAEMLAECIAQLTIAEAELKRAQDAEFGQRMSDDYCFTNGSIKPYAEAVRKAQLRVKELREGKALIEERMRELADWDA